MYEVPRRELTATAGPEKPITGNGYSKVNWARIDITKYEIETVIEDNLREMVYQYEFEIPEKIEDNLDLIIKAMTDGVN